MVHYDAARSAEVFIHRAGRTARARAAGLSLSIVAPRDDGNHRQTCKVLGLHDGMKAFPQEVRLVERARERVGMALRVRETGGGRGRREWDGALRYGSHKRLSEVPFAAGCKEIST